MGPLVDRSQVERLLLLAAALRSGLIDFLADREAVTAEVVAASLGADHEACRIVLEALVEVGVVAGGPKYRLTDLGKRHLVEEGPELERAHILHQAEKVRTWLDLPDTIRHGRRPASRRPFNVELFARTMSEGDPAAVDEVVDRVLAYFGEPPPRSMIDIGGGLGHVALRFAARGIKAWVFDTPEVARLAGRSPSLKEAGIVVVAGDFNESLPAAVFDIAYLGNVYHIYGPERNRALTARVFSVLAPGGVLAAVDHVWGRSPRARMFAVDMLQATEEGGVWSEVDFQAWMAEAGFKDVQIADLIHRKNQLILGRRPRQGR